MRTKVLSIILFILLLFQDSVLSATASREWKPSLHAASTVRDTARRNSELTVSLSTATEKSIVFKSHKQETELKPEPMNDKIPHLVLKRNGVPTPGFERTLTVSVENLFVPASGIYVQLVLETQHGDPDLDRRKHARIRVWKETRFIPYDALARQDADVQFSVTFDPVTELPDRTIKTPTDYYRFRIMTSDERANWHQSYVNNFAFLIENQWRVPLPELLEATPGAAPDELLIYYYDMMPFQTNLRDPETQIPRQEVDRYIQTELMPAMVEAIQIQSNVWQFPWYEEWHNFRREEAPKTLSVALGQHSLWFHGEPASLGHSMISIRVDGAAGEYGSLTDGIMSVFHHELFHNHQRNISLHHGKHAAIAGQNEAWMMFTEGTAVLASLIGQPTVQFDAASQPRSYLKRANAFIGSDGAVGGGLNKSYKDIPYHTAMYWRFLYENCGGVTPSAEDPATGMEVIRRILETLYRGEIVDIHSSTDVAEAFPRILDAALQSTPSCRFRSYEASLIHFARAIYMLRVEDGRCQELIDPFRCGFVDPRHLYQTPPADTYRIGANTPLDIRGSIPSSFGVDLNEVELDPSLEGKSLRLVFTSDHDPKLSFHVEVWKLKSPDENGGAGRKLVKMIETNTMADENGSQTVELGNLDSFDGLGLIITRMDPQEDTKATGSYSIKLVAE